MTNAGAAGRFGHLDTLRFAAASTVCLYHFLESQAQLSWVHTVLTSGINTGAVVLFFLISGYVMPFTVKQGTTIRAFAVRRLFRLLPLYYTALAVLALGGATGFIAHWAYMWQSGPGTWLANLLILQDFAGARPFLGVSWTLALEIIWYGLYISAVSLLGRRALLLLGLAAPAALLLLAGASLLLDTRIPLGRPAMIYAAILGCQLYQHSEGRTDARALIGWVALFVGVTTATNIVAFGLFQHDHVRLIPSLMSWIAAPLVFLATVLWAKRRPGADRSLAFVQAIGVASYSIYLLHPIAVALVRQYGLALSPIWQFIVYVLLAAALSTAGYIFIEKPGIALGKRFARRVVARSLTLKLA
jgi:peptidoglycan/LPS O-acetylase OafA/YrhL